MDLYKAALSEVDKTKLPEQHRAREDNRVRGITMRIIPCIRAMLFALVALDGHHRNAKQACWRRQDMAGARDGSFLRRCRFVELREIPSIAP